MSAMQSGYSFQFPMQTGLSGAAGAFISSALIILGLLIIILPLVEGNGVGSIIRALSR